MTRRAGPVVPGSAVTVGTGVPAPPARHVPAVLPGAGPLLGSGA